MNDFRVGRDAVCDIVLVPEFVSKVHFRIYSVLYDAESDPLYYCLALGRNGTLWNDRLLKKFEAVLLSDGDTIEILGAASFQFFQPSTRSSQGTYLDLLKTPQIHADYTLTNRLLGEGGFGAVYVAENKAGKQFAVKIVDFHKMDHTPARRELDRTAAIKETRILKELNHANILKVHEIISNERFFFMIQTLIPGGDLFSYLNRKGKLPEHDAMAIMWQLLTAVNHLHSQGIVHRDIKPDNILLSADEKNPLVILADFGVARNFDLAKPSRMSTIVGTTEYYAPEIIRDAFPDLRNRKYSRAPSVMLQGHTQAVDIWCLGIVMCMLLVNASPFARRTHPETQEAILRCNLDVMYEGREWSHLSINCKGLIGEMLREERRRISAVDARNHVWFRRHVGLLEELLARAVERSGIRR